MSQHMFCHNYVITVNMENCQKIINEIPLSGALEDCDTKLFSVQELFAAINKQKKNEMYNLATSCCQMLHSKCCC